MKSGFSLVELMVVIAIAGILTGIAGPNLAQWIYISRQSEAKNNLQMISTLQQIYVAGFGKYYDSGAAEKAICPKNALGFSQDGLRYRYVVKPIATFERFHFFAEAKAVEPKRINPSAASNKLDTWLINDDKNLVALFDSVKMIKLIGRKKDQHEKGTGNWLLTPYKKVWSERHAIVESVLVLPDAACRQ